MALVVFFQGFLKHQKIIESKYIESVNLQKAGGNSRVEHGAGQLAVSR